jgi:hypothetical protein
MAHRGASTSGSAFGGEARGAPSPQPLGSVEAYPPRAD